MKLYLHLVIGFSLLVACSGCASQKPDMLLHAEQSLESAKNDTFVMKNAPLELREAERELAQAQQVWKEDGDEERTNELAERAADTIANARSTAGKQAVGELQEDVAVQHQLLEKEERVRQAQANASLYQASAVHHAERANRIADQNENLAEQLVELKDREDLRIVLENDLLFEVDRAQLKPGGKSRLEPLASYLAQNKSRTAVVEGHTDSTGGENYNIQLSERRAEAVKSYLIQQGVGSNQIVTRGLGEQMPLSSNDTAAGRLQNRRVEIIVESDARG